MEINVAADFPKSKYMGVELQVSRHLDALGVDAASVPGFMGYAGGWNALIMRFRAADEYGASAIRSLSTQPGAPPNEERFAQERDLFGFFTQAVSAIECCCFAIYHIGRMSSPAHFLAEPKNISTQTAANDFASCFSGVPLAVALASLTVSADWEDIRDIRNMLIHRESPGRTVFLGSGSAYTARPAEWTERRISLGAALVETPRRWLGQEIEELVGDTSAFVQEQFRGGDR